MQKYLGQLACASVLLGSATLLVPTAGWAQMDDIVVTARKREENLQEVPIAVQALTVEQIQMKGVGDFAELTRYAAGLEFDQGNSPEDIRVVIRGLSPTRGRQNLAFLVDGADISSESIGSAGGSLLANQQMFDIERVEIVRGPQLALYGRSAFAGAVQYVTRKPGYEPEGRVSLDFGKYGQRRVEGSFSGPVVADKLALGLTAGEWNHDGYYDNTLTNDPLGTNEGYGVAGSALFDPVDWIQMTGRVEFTHNDYSELAQVSVSAESDLAPIPQAAIDTGVISAADLATIEGAGFPPGFYFTPQVTPSLDDVGRPSVSPNPRTGSLNPGTDVDVWRGQLNGEIDLGWGDITTITMYADSTAKVESDSLYDGSCFEQAACGERRTKTDTQVFSQELRLDFETGPVKWLAGGLYWREEAKQKNNSLILQTIVPNVTAAEVIAQLADPIPTRKWNRDTDHWSAFFLADWQFFDEWSVILEGRYFFENQNVSGPDPTATTVVVTFFPATPLPTLSGQYGPDGTGTIQSRDNSDDFFKPKATLQWTPGDDLLFYGSVAEAAKPSGYSTVSAGGGFDPSTSFFEREEMTNYEFGAKTTLLNGTLRLNGSFYYEDFTDKQTFTQQQDPNTGFLVGVPVNASAADIYGVELETVWSPAREVLGGQFAANLAYSYIDAEYNDFKVNTSGIANIVGAGNCRPVTVGGAPLCEIDFSDNTLEDTTENSVVAGISFVRPLWQQIDGLVQLDFIYNDGRYLDQANRVEIDSYSIWNLRVGGEGERWSFVGYVDNLLDDDTLKSSALLPDGKTFLSPTVIGNKTQYNLPPPRRWGLRLAFNF